MYNPTQHHRRSIRLKGYDYTSAGMYFITICCEGGTWRFGKIANGEMLLNTYGQIAYNEWVKLSERYSHATFDVFQIMPNHIHGIIIIDAPVGATLAVAQNDNNAVIGDDVRADIRAGSSPAPTDTTTVGDIVGAYKSLVFKQCLNIYKTKNETMGKLWQRNFYEHISVTNHHITALRNTLSTIPPIGIRIIFLTFRRSLNHRIIPNGGTSESTSTKK